MTRPFAAAVLASTTLLLCQPASSQDDAANWGMELQGFALGVYSARIASELPAGPEGRNFLLAEERLRLDATLWTEAVEAEARLQLDAVHDAVTGTFDFDLREAYLDYSSGNLDFRLGRQIATWGVGDLLFINDFFPKDWVSFFAGRPLEYLKLGVDSARLRYSGAALNLELMLIPSFRPDTLPTPRRFFFMQDDFAGMADRSQTLRDTGLEEPELALRLYRGIAGFDLSAYAYRGYWRAPGQQLDDPARPTRVTRFFPALSVYGFSVQRQALGGVLSFEAGYYDSRDDRAGSDPAVANSEARLLLGYQRQLSEDFTLGVQYYTEIMMNYAAYQQTLAARVVPRKKYRDIVTLRLTRLLNHQSWTASLFGFYSAAEQDYLLQPLLAYRVSDRFSATLGANLFGGKSQTTFFGQFDRNDNLFLNLRYDF